MTNYNLVSDSKFAVTFKPAKPVILCDVDGVLLDWTSRFPYFLQKKGFAHEAAIMMHANEEWKTVEELTGLESTAALELVEEYCRSKYMKYLAPYKDALIAVNHLKRYYDFVAVTAISDHPDTIQNRTDNLEFWYPNAFKEVHCVGVDGDKQAILSKYPPTVWIDDSPKHIAEGLRAGHKCIRLQRDSRANTVPSLIARDWTEISNLIQQLILPNIARL